MKLSLCDNCKGDNGIVNCDAIMCNCDCHYEIDEAIIKLEMMKHD